ncbi:unnamed protein product [Agarophyton chilense]|eukprot:gb/GEZJ01002895.1/.p2 GENE.gb/GEZJ01002895.1/~~gb/GEZJ01002895.1/.p2  ORF type:complete len:191 (-),score=29.83 gb/GEZJ01002895.1/:1947-2519(-)
MPPPRPEDTVDLSLEPPVHPEHPSMTQASHEDPHPPHATGHAPWQRDGASHAPPTDPESKAKAEKWSRHKNDDKHSREQRRKERAAERQRRKEEEERLRIERLENNARRMYIAGFFALPLVWLVALIYFREEHKDENGNQRIKEYYRGARFWFFIYTLAFVTWFIVFQVKANTFSNINIVKFSGTSPSGI